MQTILEYIRTQLKDFYSENEIQSLYLLMSEKITGLSRTELRLNKYTIFSKEQRDKLDSFIEKLKKSEPIQYILGETEFYGLNFLVNPSVLIPRPETEELIEWIKNEHNSSDQLQILDIGTGSGCIAVCLKYIFRNSSVSAFDISEKALETAQKNAILNYQNIVFRQVDILNEHKMDQKWNIIVSNPPYVPFSEKEEIQANVLNYEPHIALFAPENDPLIFYNKIAVFAANHLKPHGKLYFEIHRDAGKQCIELLNEKGLKKVELKKDIHGNDRMIRAEI